MNDVPSNFQGFRQDFKLVVFISVKFRNSHIRGTPLIGWYQGWSSSSVWSLKRKLVLFHSLEVQKNGFWYMGQCQGGTFYEGSFQILKSLSSPSTGSSFIRVLSSLHSNELFLNVVEFKGTLIQIWKSIDIQCMDMFKQKFFLQKS